MDWDVLFNGSSIADKVTSFVIIKGRGRFCKEFSLEVADYSLKTSIDLANMSGDPSIEIRTNTGSGWISEGTFFIEQCTPVQSKDVITLSLWGRDESAKLTQPFAKRMYKEYDEDTSLYEIIEEILTEHSIEYDEDRMLVDDFVIYANSYSVQGIYPIEVLQQLVSVTDGFIYTDRLGQLWVVKDEYHWDAVVTEIDGTVIESISEREDYPEFGNRVRVGSYADDGEIDASVSLQVAQSYVAVGEGVIAKAIVTRKDGSLFPDGYKVQWTSDNESYASWAKDETAILTHRITNERQVAASTRMISVDYPIRQVHSVTVVSTGETIVVKEHEGTSIALDDDLPFTDSVVIVDYSTAYATNTLTGGSTGEVEVDVHAIVEVFVRDTQTIRVDTTAGSATGEEAAYVTIIQRDFITEEIIEDPGNVRLDDILQGATEDGMLDLGLVEGGEHSISIRDVLGYKDTDSENEGLDNDTIRVGETIYTTSSGEETTDPNIITVHNDLSSIQGGQSGQYYHLTAAELAALSTYATTTAMNTAITSHAALDTGVHGAGADTLATDADITTAIAAHVAVTDPHDGYALLAGRSGGQTQYGGTGASENYVIGTTLHGTKGEFWIGSVFKFDEATGRLGFGDISGAYGGASAVPRDPLHVLNSTGSMVTFERTGANPMKWNWEIDSNGRLEFRSQEASTKYTAVTIEKGAYSTRALFVKKGYYSGRIGVNNTDPDCTFHITCPSTITNSVYRFLRLEHSTSNTAVAGFGTGIEFELEENDGSLRVAGGMECLWTDAGETISCDADLVFKLMKNDGVAAEVARMVSNGDFKIQGDLYIQGNQGWTGSFTNGDGDTVTVTGGAITGVA